MTPYLETLIGALDTIDWDALRTVRGTAAQFPEWILQLLSHDPAWRYEAMTHLWRECTPDTSVTPALVPFIREVLARDDTADKPELLHLLASFAEPPRPFQRKTREPHIRPQVLTAVRAGADLYRAFLQDSDPALREGAALLLSLFDADYLPDVRAALDAEADPHTQAKMLDAIIAQVERLAKADPGIFANAAAWLGGYAAPGYAPLVRLHAALKAPLWEPNPFSADVTQTLREAALHPDRYAKFPSALLYGPIVEQVCTALAALAPDHAIPALLACLTETTDPEDAHSFAIHALDLAFYGAVRRATWDALPEDYPVWRPDNSKLHFRLFRDTPEQQARKRARGRLYPRAECDTDPEALTPLQRTVLDAVYATELVWLLHSNLPEMYGLPCPA